mgnify:CR=1 FL=1
MLKSISFGNCEFSTYILIIGLAFLLAFIIFFRLIKKSLSKIDILYIYVINIIGFAIGAKMLSLISNEKILSLYNIINSGYSYLGGIIGSSMFIALYCYKYTLNIKDILATFSVLFPLIYSVCKLGCFLNNCCSGIIIFPLQLVDSGIMLLLFFILLLQYQKNKRYLISKFLIGFSITRFLEDYYRYYRKVIAYNLTLEQIICIAFICMGVFGICLEKNKKAI